MQNERKVVELNLNDVLPNRFQPRIKFDENSINELAESIKKYGVIQPIVVRKIGDKYEIIAGERRYKASVLAGRNSIPAIISEMSDKDSIEIALIENVQREDLTPIEKAISYKKILDMGYISQDALAQKVGKSQSSIANTLRLLNLSEEVQEALLESKISERHARSLLKLKDEKSQVQMLNRIINERLTVRKTDEEIDKMYDNNNGIDKLMSTADEVVTIPEFETNYNNVSMGNMDTNNITNENVIKEQKEELLQPGKFFNFEESKPAFNEEKNITNFAPTPTDEMLSNLNVNNVQNFEIPQTPAATPMPSFEVPQAPAAAPMPSFEAPQIPVIEPMPSFEVSSLTEENSGIEKNQDLPIMPSFEALQQAMISPTSDYINGTVDNSQINTNYNSLSNVVTKTKNTDIKTAIEKSRSFQKQLEDLGYEVDFEEIDFEDSYQVIIRISK